MFILLGGGQREASVHLGALKLVSRESWRTLMAEKTESQCCTNNLLLLARVIWNGFAFVPP